MARDPNNVIGKPLKTAAPTAIAGKPKDGYYTQDASWNAEIKERLETPLPTTHITSTDTLDSPATGGDLHLSGNLIVDGTTTVNVLNATSITVAGADIAHGDRVRIITPIEGIYDGAFVTILSNTISPATSVAGGGPGGSNFLGSGSSFQSDAPGFTFAPGNICFILVGVLWSGAVGTITSLTGGPVGITSWTQVATATDGQLTLGWFQSVGTPTATIGRVTATLTQNATQCFLNGLAYSNIDPSGTVVQSASAVATSGTIITTPFANPLSGPSNILLVGAARNPGTGTIAATDASWTNLNNGGVNFITGQMYIDGPPTTMSPQQTSSLAITHALSLGIELKKITQIQPYAAQNAGSRTEIKFPLVLTVGDRVKDLVAYCNMGVAINARQSLALWETAMDSSSLPTLVAAVIQTPTLSGLDFTMTLSSLTQVIQDNKQYYLSWIAIGSGAGKLYSIRITYDRP